LDSDVAIAIRTSADASRRVVSLAAPGQRSRFLEPEAITYGW